MQWRGSARSGHLLNEPPDSENWKVAVLIPFPKIRSGQNFENHPESGSEKGSLEILENLEILEILEIPQAKRPLS